MNVIRRSIVAKTSPARNVRASSSDSERDPQCKTAKYTLTIRFNGVAVKGHIRPLVNTVPRSISWYCACVDRSKVGIRISCHSQVVGQFG